ncbi:Protein kinase domain-containing protein [Mycena sanguinolenta]|uniref:Protein kinase domain-containing protein n=1 Tax=Mycena sanguinolenta TaxID=230812 RepID=A0A8H7DHM5_9AGAR|nr:Protein kinase domain-containing protein [Mycena sanguinolenta]
MEDQDSGEFNPVLFIRERFWVSMQPFLFAQGYQLRPRYHADWIPSWTAGTGLGLCQRYDREDRAAVFFRPALDATRICDGKKVVLKRVDASSPEIEFMKYLNRPAVRKDPRNRTIPLLDIIGPAPNTSWLFLVMPYCREFNYPPFHCRGEFVEAMTQFLEGLQFMHEHNIVHFDIAPQNMVMDESRVIPRGSHFARPDTHKGVYDQLFTWKNRCAVAPVAYYYIDFGLSKYYPDGKNTAKHTGTLRTFPNIPELSLTVPYNPFMVDLCQLGLTIEKLVNAYPDLEDFRPVADAMTAANPMERSSPEEALAHLRRIADAMDPSKLSAQIWEKDIGRWKKLCRAVLGGWYS